MIRGPEFLTLWALTEERIGEVATGPPGREGPPGEQGPQGILGRDGKDGLDGVSVQGPPGDTGREGPEGQVGPEGPAGLAGQSVIEVRVVTLPPDRKAEAVYNPDTGVLVLGIPQGKTGATGAAGPTGGRGTSRSTAYVGGGGGSAAQVFDDYLAGEVLADQAGAGAVLTFTFSEEHQLVMLESAGDGLTARADAFGGTPTLTLGVRLDHQSPKYLPVNTSSVKVFAPAGTTISCAGFRRAV